MSDFLIHLLESSLLLGLFYLIYLVGLRKESFFNLTRYYLLMAILLSLVLPYLNFDFLSEGPEVKPVQQISEFRTDYYEAFDQWVYDSSISTSHNLTNVKKESTQTIWNPMRIVTVLYLLGVTFLISRTFWLIWGICRMARNAKGEKVDDLIVLWTGESSAPFSFWKYVFVPMGLKNSEQLDQILAHERMHIQEKHTFDLIFVQLAAAVLWFNPVIWWLLKSLKSTHEYIADRKILDEGYSLVSYQTLLLSQVISLHSNGLVHNFNLSFIKKRITMMNTKSGKPGIFKAVVAIVVTAITSVIIVQCNAQFDEQALNEEVTTTPKLTAAVLPTSHAKAERQPNDRLTLTIINDQLIANDRVVEISEIASLIERENLSEQSSIILMVHGNQTMGFVKQVQNELRGLLRRKVLYMNQDAEGRTRYMPILLPPLPEDWEKVHGSPLPDLEQMAKDGEIDVLRLKLGDNGKDMFRSQVYDFVTGNVAKGVKYVVSAKVRDEDTFQVYLENLSFINEGFNQFYQERADELYDGVTFLELDTKDPEDKEKYKAIRKGIPRSISIAED